MNTTKKTGFKVAGALCCALLTMTATVAGAKESKGDLKQAAKAVTEAFKGTSFLA